MARDASPARQVLLVVAVAAVLVAVGALASLVSPEHGPWVVLAVAVAVLLVRVETWGRALMRRPVPPPADSSPAVLEMSRRLQALTAALEQREQGPRP
jgi:hypothetical protein